MKCPSFALDHFRFAAAVHRAVGAQHAVSLQRMRFVLSALALSVAVSGGCSTQAGPDDSLSANAADNGSSQGSPASSVPSTIEDASSGPMPSYRGSPLCGIPITASTCMPDDTGTHHTSNALTCFAASSDEPSTDDSDAGSEPIQGCRLVQTDSDITPVTPECVSASLAGTDGRSCSTGQECAPGFDCVEGTNGTSGSVCRRYCCAGSCDDQVAQSGGPTFCDVQALVDTNITVPVCMPLKSCTLLDFTTCESTETCAVVDNGYAGCVPVGSAQAFDSCEDTHCASGLTCIGAPGNRKCYTLCKVGDDTCDASHTCRTSSLFKDTTFGVCQST